MSNPFRWTAEIPGELASKSNQRRIVRFGNRVASIKSAKALNYVEAFLWAVKGRTPMEPYEGDVRLTAHVWYQSRRPDLDICLLQDCLQKAGVIANDRSVVQILAFKHLDKLRPRVAVVVEAIS